jgi:predicted secreted protein
MSIVSAIVLFAVIWFMVLFIVLPIRLETQGDRGEIVPGTQAGAPANLSMKRKALVTTGISVVLWVLISAVILSGAITVRDIDIFNRLGPPSAGETDG